MRLPVEQIGAVLRSIPNVRGKSRLARLGVSPWIRGRGYECVVKLDTSGGGRLICNLDDELPWDVFVHGDYNPERRCGSFMMAKASDASVVFDIGANIGYYTVQFARVAKGRVFAFEPMSYQSGVLSRNVALNELGNVVITKAAVSSEVGKVRVYFSGMSQTGGSTIVGHGETYEDVPTVTVDEFSRTEGIHTIDVVKIDVEGWEMHVLQGMSRLLEGGAVRHLFIEIVGANLERAETTAGEIVGFLGSRGYQPWSLKTGTPQPYDIEHPNDWLVYFTREAHPDGAK